LSEIKSIRDHLNKYIRELEQQNDDLERAKRYFYYNHHQNINLI
jgi:hypothetical protein